MLTLVFAKSTKRYDRYEIVDDEKKVIGTVYFPLGETPPDTVTFAVTKPE